MKKILLLFFFIIIITAILFFLNETKNMFWFSTLLAIPVSLIYKDKVGELYNSVKTLLGEENWKGDKRRLTKQCKMNEDTEVRISFAYLFRIEIEGKYFLVQNSRTGKYQPVGGVYKFNEMEHNYLKEHFSFEYDKPIAVDEVTKSDYRLYIKSKDLNAFIKRFDKTSDKENIRDLSREFKEEIFESGILNQDDFGNLSYIYCGRHMTSIIETVFHQFELLLADIVEVRLTEEQKNIIKNLMYTDSDKYKFATSAEIKARGVKFGSHDLSDSIASHSSKILIENSDKLKRRNKHKNLITVEL